MKKILASAAIISGLTVSGFSFAATGTGTATVELLTALVIDNEVDVDFATQENIDGTCTMDTAGAITGPNCSGTGSVGSFDITGTDTETVQIDLSANPPVDGVTFNPLLVSNSTTSDTATLTAGPDTIQVHGSIDISGATPGVKNLTYGINVVYN